MAASTEPVIGMKTDLREIAADVVARAMRYGATSAEAIAREGAEFSVNVRMGQVEVLKESGSRSLGVRAFSGQRAGSTYTSDLTGDGIERMVRGALELARVTSEDPHAGIPSPDQLGSFPGDLKLYYDDVYSLAPEERIEYARRAERAALDFDPRIKNSDGGSFEAAIGQYVLANSHGFVGEYGRSHCSIVAMPIAKADDGSMQSDYWYSSARTLSELTSPEEVGRTAAQRALRRLGARKIASTRVPLIFDPQMARSLLGNIFEAVSGDSIYRGASFLQGMLGKKVAGENVTVIDDGTLPGGFGSSPFDDEGVPTQRTVVIEKGILKSYLLNSYTARKLGLKTTGNASRGITGNPVTGRGNFFFEKGACPPAQIIAGVKQGLYVTEMLGHGVNLVTGDFSQGAGGLWIENGELAYPVEEITVAGNLKDMLHNIAEVGDDLEFRSSTAAPTLRIEGMTIAGE
ncbi:MAG TPA: TldD/PmbA family protein [Candidatus Saccharimonadales bacterium]|jgi:PmbA protein|nr:TldD/PmbA family protein [Candidatus Saccharimonadales bacterium]